MYIKKTQRIFSFSLGKIGEECSHALQQIHIVVTLGNESWLETIGDLVLFIKCILRNGYTKTAPSLNILDLMSVRLKKISEIPYKV